jgi:hypothetical protein
MLLKSETRVELPKTYRKILYLYPAYNNTFVFLGSVGLRQDSVTHVDANGKILFEHVFPVPMDTAGMISDREFIMVETRSKFYLGPEGAE